MRDAVLKNLYQLMNTVKSIKTQKFILAAVIPRVKVDDAVVTISHQGLISLLTLLVADVLCPQGHLAT
jgi:hypothetical protein